MAVNQSSAPKKQYSEQHRGNYGWDEDLQAPFTEVAGYDGKSLQRINADSMATKVTVDGTTTYVAFAAPGTSQSESKWQCLKIDSSSGAVVAYADGNSEFDNVATDLTALTYS